MCYQFCDVQALAVCSVEMRILQSASLMKKSYCKYAKAVGGRILVYVSLLLKDINMRNIASCAKVQIFQKYEGHLESKERFAIKKYLLIIRKNFNFKYEGHLESKERFAIKKYLLIIGKKKNMQVLSHTFTYFST